MFFVLDYLVYHCAPVDVYALVLYYQLLAVLFIDFLIRDLQAAELTGHLIGEVTDCQG